ncbi:putative serine/threonine protein kinase [Blattamonas nauphoetae]|uniref:Serine/threonine protein kinase n=1 Tax=Blattamonas nauphoetae TaxID=2049346 RepID=A0ABQ9X7P7_9EUKA|nr:putative serine/threonine protein kinase [Blattamonas nauphoetae]
MKVLPFTSEEDFNKNEHEIAKLQKYQHSNVVRLVEVIEGDAAHYVVLELCSCSLADRVSEVRKLGTMMDRVTVFRIVSDVLAGLGFLHSRNEVYGDVKPSNILIGFDGRAKLGDFGGVVGVGTQKTSNSAECGTMQFWGPEMFVVGGNGVLGSQAGDMWAFGLIVLELLTGESWICGTNAVEIASSVGGFDVVSVCRQASMSSSVESLLCFLLSKNPQERLSSAELIRSGRLRSILGEETPLSQFLREELDSSTASFQAQLTERNDTITKQANLMTEQATTISELTKKLGEYVAMEKRQTDKPNTTHSKVVAVENPKTEAAKDVKRIGGSVDPENAITVWNPNHFRKEGRRITRFGVIDSSKLEQSKTGDLYDQPGASVFYLNYGSVHQNGKKIASGNQKAKPNSVVTIELDMNRHTLVLFVDDERQPHSLANIPQNVRFALEIYYTNKSADIVSFEEVSARK